MFLSDKGDNFRGAVGGVRAALVGGVVLETFKEMEGVCGKGVESGVCTGAKGECGMDFVFEAGEAFGGDKIDNGIEGDCGEIGVFGGDERLLLLGGGRRAGCEIHDFRFRRYV